MKKKKCLVLFSGGLDSRLAIKIMQEQGFEVIALYFDLPFGKGCCNSGCSFNFSQMHNVKLKVLDCKRGKLLKEYLQTQKKAVHGRGAGVNACVDCRIFIFKKAKEFADNLKIDLIVTGEVLGERPMSQMKKSMNVIEKESNLQGRLLRPLSAKLLPETNAEKQGLVNREKLYGIFGRRREQQMKLAKKFKIDYPSPGGGCALCEKLLKKRYQFLLNRGFEDREYPVVNIGRHFLVNGCWAVLGRNQSENEIIENLKVGELIVPNFNGPSARILDKTDSETSKKVEEIVLAYSSKGSLKKRKIFWENKL